MKSDGLVKTRDSRKPCDVYLMEYIVLMLKYGISNTIVLEILYLQHNNVEDNIVYH